MVSGSLIIKGSLPKCKCGVILKQNVKQCRDCWRKSFGSIRERFWSKVKKKGTCWEFIGAKDRFGYGHFSINNKSILAHRVSWYLFYENVPSVCVLHKCDNPPCVNPSHLFEGTDADNKKDMRKKGRGFIPPPMQGSNHFQSKLDEATVIEIRSLYNDGVSSTKIHRKYSIVQYSTINKIIRHKTWQHI